MQGRWYMLVELLSQSYRCVLPITPWIYFLTDDDEGSQLSFAKALLVAYVCFKVTHSRQRRIWHVQPNRGTTKGGLHSPQNVGQQCIVSFKHSFGAARYFLASLRLPTSESRISNQVIAAKIHTVIMLNSW